MHISAIICEYNPFHTGHAYHIAQTRALGATHVVAIMSGNFVQRGEPALLNKWARARAALAGGADLVIELPLSWACASADRFAYGGVFLANALGCVQTLSFGSECGDISLLTQIAQAVISPQAQPLIQQGLALGLPFAAARQRAVAQLIGQKRASTLGRANDILGVEYLKALRQLGSSITPIALPRAGAGHDAAPQGQYASASWLRQRLLAQPADFKSTLPYLPQDTIRILQEEYASGRAPACLSRLERGVLLRLRAMLPQDFLLLPDVGEGLENRICAAVRQACSLPDAIDKIKTKRYTHARIRRIILGAVLGLDRRRLELPPPYLRVLGCNLRGREILRKARTTASLPVVMHPKDILSRYSPSTPEYEHFALESLASDFYHLTTPKVFPCGLDRTVNPVILKT
ncbi:MAG TPA: nucleotidyltransferase family protein [Candidatus Gallacutalibacter stercoravium]|nr:nucleotidyltransferase family protein [Candidatus Gallacutalibacter stercoravium]